MVKKVKKTAGSQPSADTPPAGPGLLDGQFGQLVKESAQQIWSAGLAAFAKAQNNSGKAFDHLAAEGARLQKKTQATAEERLGTVATRMSDMAGEVGTRAGQHWDKLESIFEDRVARALNRLGAPSAKDFAALNARLDALTAALQAQGGVPASAAVAKPAKAAKSAKPGKQAKAAKPAKPGKPAEAAKAVKAAKAKTPAAAPAKAPAQPQRAATKVAAAAPAKTAAKPVAKPKPAMRVAANAAQASKSTKTTKTSAPTRARQKTAAR